MIIHYDDLPRLRAQCRDKRIVFTSGSFDLPHAGHARYLEECRKQGDVLVVAVGKDQDIKVHKGAGRPILNEQVRVKMVDSLKPVDYALLLKSPLPGAHLHSPLVEVFQSLKPDRYVLNYDAMNLDFHKGQCKNVGVEFVILNLDRNEPPEFESISTSGIIEKIKRLS